MYIIKRDGTQVDFDKMKINNAITSANIEVPEEDRLTKEEINSIVEEITIKAKNAKYSFNVEDIQNMVEDSINSMHKFNLGRVYSTYRYKQAMKRNKSILKEKIKAIVDMKSEDIKQENSNKNPQIAPTQRDYMAGEISKEITMEDLLPIDIVNAHNEGIIHFHDADYFVNHIYNCCLVNLEDMFKNDTVISETKIESPKSFLTGCNIMTQIMAQIASSQYGGQSMTLSHIAPLVDVSRQKIKCEVLKVFEVGSENELDTINHDLFKKLVESRLHSEIVAGVQTIQYQILTLLTTNGQTPFVTLFMYLDEVEDGQTREDLALIIEEVLRQRMKGVQNEKGEWITPAFPKLIYVLDEDNTYEDSRYFYLTKLAAQCTAKRMVPDYISAKKMREYKDGNVYPCMGCRSFLTSEKDIKNPDGTQKFYGRFNQGVVTINLPDIALSSGGNFYDFWEIYEERLELCHKALRKRHERLLGTTSDIAPILWQYGAIARLEKGEKIDKLLYGGYSTISLGYAGLYECVKYMTGKSHTDKEATQFAIEVMQKLNDKCNEWREIENIAYSVYGTPLESTTYKFAKSLQKRFGIIEGITDHNYITNSYHINVREEVNAFDKLLFESEFQKLSPGGAISYVETPDLTQNEGVVLQIMQFIYENTIYAELNTRSDYCQVCGSTKEIKIVSEENSGKLIWECSCCGNRNQNKMNVARRTCGYIGTQFWNQGRTEEIKDRVIHIDNKEYTYDE